MSNRSEPIQSGPPARRMPGTSYAKRISSRNGTLTAVKRLAVGRSIWTARSPDRFGLTDATSKAGVRGSAGGDWAVTTAAQRSHDIHRIGTDGNYHDSD